MENEKFQDLMLEQFAKLFKEVQGVKGELTGVKDELASVKADVAGLKTDVAGLKTDVAELKTDVAGLKTDVAELKTDVAGLKTDVTELKTDVRNLKDSQIRMENKFDEQITALHDFRVYQERVNQEVRDALTGLGTKVEELQFEARANEEKFEDMREDINYLARKAILRDKEMSTLRKLKQAQG